MQTKLVRTKNEYTMGFPGSYSTEGVIFSMSVSRGGVIQGNTVFSLSNFLFRKNRRDFNGGGPASCLCQSVISVHFRENRQRP